ncbi:MAG: YicC family protein [Deltaproteobacteria bacterium]|nr:YicC family protein [Deltaproteobacteria bacterium]
MLKSMTGYGKGEVSSFKGDFLVEIRSVNHRYGEVSIKMPRSFMALENEVKRLVLSVIKRGKIDVFVQWTEAATSDTIPRIDHVAARSYREAFSTLADELQLAREIPLTLIVSQRGVMKDAALSVDETEYQPVLLAAVRSAVEAIDAMREREGDALVVDLMARRRQVAEWVGVISERAPAVVLEYRQKLTARLDLLLEGKEMDEARLAQEVALMADRSDITEELVRLASHFSQFDETLLMPEPVGRKLDFLMQEMNREVNTIGSKSNDVEITTLVIRIKAEMEKMREQVQNVE